MRAGARLLRRCVLFAALAMPSVAVAQDETDDTDDTDAEEEASDEGHDDEALESKGPPAAVEQKKPQPDPRVTLDEILKDKRYVYCHDPERPVRWDLASCDFAKDQVPECAAFTAACKKLEREPEKERTSFSLPPALAWLAQILFWGGLLLLVLWWIVKMSKNLFDDSSEEGEVRDSLPPLTQEESEAALPQVDKDALRLLNGAKKALGQGDDVAASRLAHAALIRALEAAGHLHVARTSTNGDYVRALRERPEFRSVVKDSSREVEKSEFGKEPPAHDGVERLLSRIEPIVRSAAALLVFLVCLSVIGCGSRRATELPEDEPGGNSVLRELFVRRDATFDRRTNPLSELNDENEADPTDVLILSSYVALEEQDWAAVLTWVKNGGHLMILGEDPDLPEELGVTGRKGAACEGRVDATSNRIPGGGKVTTDVRPLDLSDKWEAIARCDKGTVIATRELEAGLVDIFGDADFVTNASLSSADHARVLMDLAEPVFSVSFVDQRFSAGAESPYNAIVKSGMTVLLAQGLVFMLVCALWQRAGFGPRKDVLPPPRHAFSEHVQAVARLYARSGASRHAFAAYSGWAIDRLNARLRPGAAVKIVELGATIAKTTGRKESDVMRVLAEAVDARDRPSMPSQKNDDLAALAALDDLVNETGGLK